VARMILMANVMVNGSVAARRLSEDYVVSRDPGKPKASSGGTQLP